MKINDRTSGRVPCRKFRNKLLMRASRTPIAHVRAIFIVPLIMHKLMTLGMSASAVPHDFHSRRACLSIRVRRKEPCKKKEKLRRLVIYRRETKMGRADRQETGMCY